MFYICDSDISLFERRKIENMKIKMIDVFQDQFIFIMEIYQYVYFLFFCFVRIVVDEMCVDFMKDFEVISFFKVFQVWVGVYFVFLSGMNLEINYRYQGKMLYLILKIFFIEERNMCDMCRK